MQARISGQKNIKREDRGSKITKGKNNVRIKTKKKTGDKNKTKKGMGFVLFP